MTRRRRTRKRLAIGIAVPAVLLFLGILFALLLPYNFFVICEALDSLGLLGGRTRVEGLAARPPGAAPAPPLHIVNGLLWDAQHGRRPNPGLAIDAGRIVEAPVPGARRIDASGMTILPGFIDMHVHSYGGTFEGEMLLGSGVTTARDLGTQLAGALRHRQEAAEGRRLSPRLIVTGPYLVAGETTSDQEEGVAGPADAARAVARFAAAGVDGIKVHRGVDAETMKAVVQTAHAHRLWVAAHLDGVGAAEAAALQVDTLEHAWEIDAAAGSDAEREVIRALVRAGVALTPTLVVADHAFRMQELSRPDNPAMAYFPALMRRVWVASQMANAAAYGLSTDQVDRRRRRLSRMLLFVGRFHQEGGRVLAGSDTPAFLVAPGLDFPRELELLVEAGLSPHEALASATSEAAAVLGLSEEIGGLSPGMRADLVLVRGDPLTASAGGLAALRRVARVVQNGHIVIDRVD